jgi:hypothetical protein
MDTSVFWEEWLMDERVKPPGIKKTAIFQPEFMSPLIIGYLMGSPSIKKIAIFSAQMYGPLHHCHFATAVSRNR